MAQYNSMDDLAAKAEWEGGLPTLILDYGLRQEDLPPDAPEGLWDAIHAFVVAYRVLEQMVPDPDL